VPLTDLTEARPSISAQLRNEPVQARSTARLTALLDAAAAAVHDLGFERLTTAMVAERAGASIGTVYRYFPDRIAVLQALAGRNLERVVARIQAALADESVTTWQQGADAVFDVWVEAFRTEPGFSSLRTGDVIDLRPAVSPTTFNSDIAATVVALLAKRVGTPDTSAEVFAFENAIEVMDALIARAFARSDSGDESFLATGRAIVQAQLAPSFTS